MVVIAVAIIIIIMIKFEIMVVINVDDINTVIVYGIVAFLRSSYICGKVSSSSCFINTISNNPGGPVPGSSSGID